VVRSLPDHSLLDRLVRGRAWIPVLGVLLAGIVAMQVEVLKLGTSMGRSIERSSALQSQNELLQANVASLADDQRIERLAAGMGMVMPGPAAVAFLSAPPAGSVGQAIANIRAPDPAGFAAAVSAQAAASAAAASVAAAATSTPSQAAPTSSSAAGVPSSTSTPSPSSAAVASGQASTTSAATAPAQGPASTGSTTATPGPATGAAAIAPPGSGQTSSASGG
jgi:hypothetical protein